MASVCRQAGNFHPNYRQLQKSDNKSDHKEVFGARPYLGPISPSHCHHSLAYLFGYTHFKQTIYQSENNNLGCQYLFMFLLFFIDNRLGDFCCWYYNISQYIDAGRWLWKAIFLPVNCDTLNECKIDLVSVFKQSQSVFPSTENWIFHLW